MSPFKTHFKQIYDEKLKLLSNEDVKIFPNNKLYSQQFFYRVLTNLLPTVPLWSGLLLGDLSRHGVGQSYAEYVKHLKKNPRITHTFNENFKSSNRTTGISEKRMSDLYNSLLGGKQAARLDDIVDLLYENIQGMQRMFTDSITAKLVSTDKTTKVVQENWNKKRGKRFKACTYQVGSERDKTINLPPHNENKDRSSKKRKSQKKEEANPVTEANKSLSPLPKTQKQKNRNTILKTKTCITKDFTEIDIESTSICVSH